ncbi:hypothetical protein FA13DRAFT_931768 [Coprinellus micaceus]|uniref:Uncharacterized protein n=1 Tax=Coprinellus micaceus TaxID=71717 RepID=A0A4Y7SZR1_COPMI|nr:hypothetical protein FA13DRAFT_931768 [Coprinellus micaceus]
MALPSPFRSCHFPHRALSPRLPSDLPPLAPSSATRIPLASSDLRPSSLSPFLISPVPPSSRSPLSTAHRRCVERRTIAWGRFLSPGAPAVRSSSRLVLSRSPRNRRVMGGGGLNRRVSFRCVPSHLERRSAPPADPCLYLLPSFALTPSTPPLSCREPGERAGPSFSRS